MTTMTRRRGILHLDLDCFYCQVRRWAARVDAPAVPPWRRRKVMPLRPSRAAISGRAQAPRHSARHPPGGAAVGRADRSQLRREGCGYVSAARTRCCAVQPRSAQACVYQPLCLGQGVRRGDRAEVGRDKCPGLVLVHVETIGDGGSGTAPESTSADAGAAPPHTVPDRDTCKVSRARAVVAGRGGPRGRAREHPRPSILPPYCSSLLAFYECSGGLLLDVVLTGFGISGHGRWGPALRTGES